MTHDIPKVTKNYILTTLPFQIPKFLKIHNFYIKNQKKFQKSFRNKSLPISGGLKWKFYKISKIGRPGH